MVATLIKGQYQVIKELPGGGFGKIYLAEDTHRPSRRRCILKQLKPVTHDPQVYEIVQQRFREEASTLEILGEGSDQIPALYGYFEDAGLFYLAQEWIEGETLAQRMQTAGPVEEETARRILSQTLPVLAFIHSQNKIHRDLKPDNIILRQRDSQPVLIDFGAVKQVMGTQLNSQGQTTTSVVIGTPGYMPAEQAAGHPIFSSDLYSLSLTMIFLLTGKLPTDLDSDPRTGELIWRQYAPDISTELADVLEQAIRYHPKDRFATANEMLAALLPRASSPVEPTLKGPFSPVDPTRLQVPPTTRQSKERRPLNVSKFLLGGLVGLGVLGAVGVGGFFVFRPQIAYTQGVSNLERGKFRPAIAKLNQAIEQKSGYKTAYLKRGEAHIEVGDYQAAVEDFETVLKQDPDSAKAYLGQGLARTQIGQYEDAIKDFNQAIRKDAEKAEAFVVRGNVRFVTGQYSEAISDFTQALALDANDKTQAQAHGGLYAAQLVQGKYKEAEESIAKAIDLAPNLIEAYSERGLFFRDIIGNKKAAYEDWTKALQLEPVHAVDYLALGNVRSKLGDKQGALNEYGRALQINPNFAPVYLAQGNLFNEQGEKQKAIDTITKALEINPNAADAYLYRGNIRLHQGDRTDVQGALADIDKALTINPKHFSALNTRCTIRTNLKNYEGALLDCNKALGINPNLSNLYNQRASVRKASGDLQGAIQDYSEAIELRERYGQEAQSGTNYANRADARFAVGDRKGALEDMNKAVKLAPNAINYNVRGQLRLTLSDLEGAKADLQKAADLFLKDDRTQSYNQVIALLKKLELTSPSKKG